MGCDIHFHSEVKIKGKWHHHSECHIARNYPFFAKIAGVRNHYGIKPISKPRGLPEDATELTKLASERMGSEGHSHSWLGAEEISSLHKWVKSQSNPDWFTEYSFMWLHFNLPYFLGNHLSGFADYPEDFEGTGVEDVRYVFFFDN